MFHFKAGSVDLLAEVLSRVPRPVAYALFSRLIFGGDGVVVSLQAGSPFVLKVPTRLCQESDREPPLNLHPMDGHRLQYWARHCPGHRRIIFARYKNGATAPFRMYEGYVASGQFMAGTFFYRGNEWPVDAPSGPLSAAKK